MGLSVDKGWAWVVLWGTCTCQFIRIGQVTSFGLFYVYIQEKLNVTVADVAVIGSLSSGIMSLAAPVASPLAKKFAYRPVAITGALITVVSWLICYFWTTLYTFYIFIGACAGIGYSLTYAASLLAINDYFSDKKYFALAVNQAVCSLGTLAFGPLTSYLLETYGLQGSILISSGIYFNVVVGAAIFFPQDNRKSDQDGILVVQQIRDAFKMYKDPKLWKCPAFYLILISFAMRGFSKFIPFHLLPRTMLSLNIPINIAALCVSAIGAAEASSRILVGVVVNRYKGSPRFIYIGGGVFSGVCLLAIPFIRSQLGFILISTGFGLCFGCVSGLYYVMLVDLIGAERFAACFGVAVLADGIGIMMGGPTAGAVAELIPLPGVEYILTASVCILCGLVMTPTLFTKRNSSVYKLEEQTSLRTNTDSTING